MSPKVEEPMISTQQLPDDDGATQDAVEEDVSIGANGSGEQLKPSAFTIVAGRRGQVHQRRPEKRPAATHVGETQPKKARVDVDLTIEDDDDIVVVEEERVAQAETKIQASPANDQEASDLKAELEDLKLQEQQMQVKRKKMEIRREQLQKKTPSDAFVKSEGIVKIQD